MAYNSSETFYRKPLSFNQYYFLLVKSHGLWCFDCGSWDENIILRAQREEKRVNPYNQCKVCTAPSDDEKIYTRIIFEMNRFAH
jgi:hypothetical protein